MERKTPPAQVAQCQHTIGTSTGVRYSNHKVFSTRARSTLRRCPCVSCIWLLHPTPILVPKMALTLCNLRWWRFFFHRLTQTLHLHSWWSSPAATCAGGVLPWSTSAFTDVHTNKKACIATCTPLPWQQTVSVGVINPMQGD